MPSKRVSRGRKKGGKGSSGIVQCTNCGQTVPKDKAKKVHHVLIWLNINLPRNFELKEHTLHLLKF